MEALCDYCVYIFGIDSYVVCSHNILVAISGPNQQSTLTHIILNLQYNVKCLQLMSLPY